MDTRGARVARGDAGNSRGHAEPGWPTGQAVESRRRRAVWRTRQEPRGLCRPGRMVRISAAAVHARGTPVLAGWTCEPGRCRTDGRRRAVVAERDARTAPALERHVVEFCRRRTGPRCICGTDSGFRAADRSISCARRARARQRSSSTAQDQCNGRRRRCGDYDGHHVAPRCSRWRGRQSVRRAGEGARSQGTDSGSARDVGRTAEVRSRCARLLDARSLDVRRTARRYAGRRSSTCRGRWIVRPIFRPPR